MLEMENKPDQRFFRIFGKKLQVGLETTFLKNFTAPSLPEGFLVRSSKSPEAKTDGLLHPATVVGTDLLDCAYSPLSAEDKLVIQFTEVPAGVSSLFQRLNLKQGHDRLVQGLVCARFTMFPEKPEPPHFIIKHKNEDPQSPVGHLNLDCFSKAKIWNPLYVRYHLSVAPAMRDFEFGYLKIDAIMENGCITVIASRTSESSVPETLKTAPTFPF